MPPPQLEQVRARRAVHEIQREYARRLAEGPEITTDVDLRDPYATEVDDVVRISRAAQLAKTGVVVWDARRHHLDWSGEMSILLGYAPGERQPSGWRLLSHLHEDDRDATLKQVIDAWRQGTAVELTFRIVRANNTIYAHSLVEILTTADGSPYGSSPPPATPPASNSPARNATGSPGVTAPLKLVTSRTTPKPAYLMRRRSPTNSTAPTVPALAHYLSSPRHRSPELRTPASTTAMTATWLQPSRPRSPRSLAPQTSAPPRPTRIRRRHALCPSRCRATGRR